MLSVIYAAWTQDRAKTAADACNYCTARKGHQDQELGDVPGYGESILYLRGILGVKDDGYEHTRADGNFSDMSIHIGTKRENKRIMKVKWMK